MPQMERAQEWFGGLTAEAREALVAAALPWPEVPAAFVEEITRSGYVAVAAGGLHLAYKPVEAQLVAVSEARRRALQTQDAEAAQAAFIVMQELERQLTT